MRMTSFATLAIVITLAMASCVRPFGGKPIDGILMMPNADELNGYFFYPNGVFYCINQSGANVGLQYLGSSGTWKLEKGRLMAKFLRHYYFQNRPTRIDMPARTYDYGKRNPLRNLPASLPEQDLGSVVQFERDLASYLNGRTTKIRTVTLRMPIGAFYFQPAVLEYRGKIKDMAKDYLEIIDSFDGSVEGRPDEWKPKD